MKNKKKLKLRQWVIDIFGVMTLFLILIVGIVLLDARLVDLNQQKSADVSEVQTAQFNR